LASLGSTHHGLRPIEAERRLEQHGPNRIERLQRTSWPLRLLREFFQFFSIILWIAALLLSGRVAIRAYLFFALEAAGAMAAFFLALLPGGWERSQALSPGNTLFMQATTACLSAIIVLQIVNVFICLSSVRSVFAMNPFDNRLIILGVVLEIVLLALFNYTRIGNAALETLPVPAVFWAFIGPIAFLMLALEEARKWLIRRRISISLNQNGTF
jgi:magnesium-transporting ATPase (P-type)